LLVLTNDGELARRLMHPSFHVPKIYRVKVKGRPSEAALKKLRSGTIVLGDRPVAPAQVSVIKKGEDRTWLRVTLIEGRNRQVRRMCGYVGHDVLKLKRTAYGPLNLGRMPSGAIRELTVAEKAALMTAVGIMSGKSESKPRKK
jgi:23S rRNA pseudouridine2605 synthase